MITPPALSSVAPSSKLQSLPPTVSSKSSPGLQPPQMTLQILSPSSKQTLVALVRRVLRVKYTNRYRRIRERSLLVVWQASSSCPTAISVRIMTLRMVKSSSNLCRTTSSLNVTFFSQPSSSREVLFASATKTSICITQSSKNWEREDSEWCIGQSAGSQEWRGRPRC